VALITNHVSSTTGGVAGEVGAAAGPSARDVEVVVEEGFVSAPFSFDSSFDTTVDSKVDSGDCCEDCSCGGDEEIELLPPPEGLAALGLWGA
jgi:hypothetical protein